jgi:hypothetical protein
MFNLSIFNTQLDIFMIKLNSFYLGKFVQLNTDTFYVDRFDIFNLMLACLIFASLMLIGLIFLV